MTEPVVASPFLTTEEAATWLRVTRQTLAAWERENKAPPCVRLGGPTGPRRYRISDLETWIEAGNLPSVDSVAVDG